MTKRKPAAKKTSSRKPRLTASARGGQNKVLTAETGFSNYKKAEDGDKPCLCGCEFAVSKSANFLPGHDAKLKAKIKAYMDEKVTVHGIPPDGWTYARANWADLLNLNPQ